jgi:hypothetical protein
MVPLLPARGIHLQVGTSAFRPLPVFRASIRIGQARAFPNIHDELRVVQ